MKKLSVLFLLLLALVLTFSMVACDSETPAGGTPNGDTPGEDVPSLKDITGVTLADATFTYDGTEKQIAVSGTLPEGVTVTYTNNKATNAGTYAVTAVLSGEGYNTLTLNATLTVNKADITGVTLSNDSFTYDGTEKQIAVSGTLPEGVTVTYTNNKATNAGTYAATAVLSGSNYNTLTLNATLTVNKAQITGITAEANQQIDADGEMHLPVYSGTLPQGVAVKYMVDTTEKPNGVSALGTYNFKLIFSGANYETLELPVIYKIKLNAIRFATNVINAFGTAPDPWSFLPEKFAPQYHTIAAAPNYDSFLNVSNIPANGIGKQMNVAYGLLNKTSLALSYVNTIMNSLNGIKTLYTTYLDSAPADYQNYEGSIAGFTFTLALNGDAYLLRATVGSVVVELYSNVTENYYGATVKLTETTVLKYTVSDDALLIALNILNASSTQIEFSRNEDGDAIGLLYEYLTVAGHEVTATSAMIEVNEDYTIVIGTKGDFIPTSVSRNCEIYDNETGCLVGSEVREDVDGTVFNTYWFPLYNLNGISSIKKVDQMNITNPDTIYINGISDDTLHTKTMGFSFGGKFASRRYDIEFKTVYGYTYNTDTGEYEEVTYEIPMIFIQEEVIDTFEEDFVEKNEDALGAGGVTLLVYTDDFNAIKRGYEVLLPIYDEVKDAVTQQMISDYCKQ